MNYYNTILKIKKIDDKAIIPKYQTEGAAGFDLHSNEEWTIAPGGKGFVRTGLAVEVPKGYEMQIRQRSGLSISYPNYIAIGIGTIDADFRGEVKVPIINNSLEMFRIKKGERIAQAIISPVEIPKIMVVEELSETKRGSGGFGSTGT